MLQSPSFEKYYITEQSCLIRLLFNFMWPHNIITRVKFWIQLFRHHLCSYIFYPHFIIHFPSCPTWTEILRHKNARAGLRHKCLRTLASDIGIFWDTLRVRSASSELVHSVRVLPIHPTLVQIDEKYYIWERVVMWNQSLIDVRWLEISTGFMIRHCFSYDFFFVDVLKFKCHDRRVE